MVFIRAFLTALICFFIGISLSYWASALFRRALRSWPRLWKGRYPLFCAVWVLGLAILLYAIGRMPWGPSFSLSALSLVPGVMHLIGYLSAHRRTRALDGSAITCFHAVRGLVRAGISLPTALFQVARRFHDPFADALAKQLAHYDEGRSLEICLERFRDRNSLALTSLTLRVLETAYRQGLPILPVLDRILPVLEHEYAIEEKTETLCRSALGQGAVAALLPWGVIAFLNWVQPEMAAGAFESRTFWCGVMGCLGWQASGVWMLWKSSKYC